MAVDGSRVAVITGASSGIGKEVAKGLAAQGWRIIGTGRNTDRMATAAAEIRAVSTTMTVDMIAADLSLMASVKETVRRIAALTDRVHILVNNAGGMASEKRMTTEGLEANFAGNHLGAFLLTAKILPLLQVAAAEVPAGTVRILNTASDASEMIPSIDLDDLQSLKHFSPGLAYCTGKLANVLFMRGLAKRLGSYGISAHAVHPGAVDSNFFSYAPADTQKRALGLEKATEAEGADTLIWLASAHEAAETSGGYWYRRQLREPNPIVHDDAIVERFWKESQTLINFAYE